MKIAVITCYHDPDYVRARTLRAALKLVPDVKTIVIKNRHTGLLRYPEVLWKVWRVKKTKKPDVYLITFRGYEILPFVLLLARKKPVIFDELIVPILHATNEGHSRSFGITVKHFLSRVSEPFYRQWLRRCSAVLADTDAHAELSAKTSHMNLSKYTALPVSADEKVFHPSSKAKSTTDSFQVFYYGNMLPLHGLSVVLEAAELLKDNPAITFSLVGGKQRTRQAVRAARKRGAQITYTHWLPFEDLATAMQQADVCLGGPFGNTQQAHHVITGKTYQFLACAAPVIVGDSEATAEYFVDKQNALIVPQGNATALAKAITWGYKNPEELAAIAAKGRALYEKQFSIQAISRTLQALVSNL